MWKRAASKFLRSGCDPGTGGFGYRGVEGKIATDARYARENNIPSGYLPGGMQVALIEFARNVAGMENANSTEFVPD